MCKEKEHGIYYLDPRIVERNSHHIRFDIVLDRSFNGIIPFGCNIAILKTRYIIIARQ